MPSLSHNGEIITESAIVAQFLADTYPSHLVPASSDPAGPLARARIAFFVDAWFSKVSGLYMKSLAAKTADEAAGFADDVVKGVAKEIEPLLGNAGPFFGGSEKLTLAEVSDGCLYLCLFVDLWRGLVLFFSSSFFLCFLVPFITRLISRPLD